ncbi:MAG: hypothetical protein Q4F69_01395 [Bacteroidia bacterium]|nr:hypothetical protein [Bacteroidia bacterium]
MKKFLLVLGLVFVSLFIYAMSSSSSTNSSKAESRTYEIRGNCETLHLYDGEIVTVSMTGSQNCDLIFKHSNLANDYASIKGFTWFHDGISWFKFYVNRKEISLGLEDGANYFVKLPRCIYVGGRSCTLVEI